MHHSVLRICPVDVSLQKVPLDRWWYMYLTIAMFEETSVPVCLALHLRTSIFCAPHQSKDNMWSYRIGSAVVVACKYAKSTFWVTDNFLLVYYFLLKDQLLHLTVLMLPSAMSLIYEYTFPYFFCRVSGPRIRTKLHRRMSL